MHYLSAKSVANFFTLFPGRNRPLALLLVCLSFGPGILRAQTNAPTPIPDPTLLETPGAAARSYPVAEPAVTPTPAALPAPLPVVTTAPVVAPIARVYVPETNRLGLSILAALMTLTALGGFLLYHNGLTQAKNCAHSAMLLLLGVSFGLVGYWMGGFAVQTGGIGDAHAALAQPLEVGDLGALDHELGPMLGRHHWGFMGNAGFFLVSDNASRNGIATLFFLQAVLLAVAIAAALGAALERGRLLAMAVIAFLTGAVIYPLVANWIWGGGWLAETGREFGLGHGVIDLAGAGVVHETAGALALVIAVGLGARHGRFQRNMVTAIPGHNVPFTILGALVLLIAFTASNISASGGGSGPAGVNVILGALGALLFSVFLGAWRKQKADPARLSRGLLGGAVSICGGGALFDAWAAFFIGACAGLLVEGVVVLLERRWIDDPVNVVATHGAGGAWGLLATGLFANGSAGSGMNGVAGTVRGLFFGGSWHQLAAQALGCVVDFAVVFGLGYLAVQAVQKILGNRVALADELQGLDWPQTGALGYQADVEPEVLLIESPPPTAQNYFRTERGSEERKR